MRTKLRKHQQAALRAGLRHFRQESRGKLIAPCGSGKTLIGMWISQKLGNKTVVTAHNIGLVRQNLTTWLNELGPQSPAICCICSDTTVGNPDVEFLQNEKGIPCLTEPNEISRWLSQNKNRPITVFTTYQSGKNLAKAAKKTKTTFDVGIIDEAHKTAGNLDKPFGIFLHDRNIRIKKRVFMTATERRYRGRSENQAISMENEKIYGKTFYHLSYRKALLESPKILCDYQVLIIRVSKEEIKEMIISEKMVLPKGKDWDPASAKNIAGVIALRRAMREYPITHSLSFHNTIQGAESFKKIQESFSRHYRKWGRLPTFHINGTMKVEDRVEIFNEFKAQKKASITNARCLIEGIDIPQINAIVFVDGKYSTIDTIQGVGRAMRPHPGKRKSYIVVPLILEENDKGLKQTTDILRCLATTDDRIIQYFQLTQESERKNNLIRFHQSAPKGDYPEIEIKEFTRNIRLKCWKKVAYQLAWRPFPQAREYARSLKLKSGEEWKKLWREGKLPADLPSNPDTTYGPQVGWRGWPNWLKEDPNYFSFKEAKQEIQRLKITPAAWRKMKKDGKLPNRMHPSPNTFYKKEWENWYDWFGNEPRQKEFLPFKQARAFVRKLRLKSSNEYKTWRVKGIPGKPKRPQNIPKSPQWIYRDQWINMPDWIGTTKKELLPFAKARIISRALCKKHGVTNLTEWVRLPRKILLEAQLPVFPKLPYREEWISAEDWIGVKQRWTFEDARAFARKLKLRTLKEWLDYTQGKITGKRPKPKGIPNYPGEVYKGEFKGIHDWLGSEKPTPRKKPKPVKPKPKKRKRPKRRKKRGPRIQRWEFKKAQRFVQNLHLRTSCATWQDYCVGRFPNLPPRPDGIPTNPKAIYKKEWKGWKAWMSNDKQCTVGDLAKNHSWRRTHYALYGTGRGRIKWENAIFSESRRTVTLIGKDSQGVIKGAIAYPDTPMILVSSKSHLSG
jgi:superfamily II DNA or RNA helicase